VGCGADELIDLLLRCVLNEGDKIVDCPPTFTMYAFDTDVNAGEIITIPRLDGFKLDVPAIQAAVVEHRPKVVFLTSPNNPDGSTISEDELLEILNLPVLVVLDEAYIEFSGEESRMPWVTRKPNLIVLRTFSKSAGLAGLRVGCASCKLVSSELFFLSQRLAKPLGMGCLTCVHSSVTRWECVKTYVLLLSIDSGLHAPTYHGLVEYETAWVNIGWRQDPKIFLRPRSRWIPGNWYT
jgi:aspartate/methionine/tyrosine aminotransferase